MASRCGERRCIVIDHAGLANDSTPAFSLEFNDHVLSIDARCASAITRFRTRPALCEYVPTVPSNRNATGEVALLMVANAPAYLFRLWGPFLNKLLFATDAGLRPFLWLGDMPSGLRKPTSDACLHSREMRHILGKHRRLGRSFYDGERGPGECSNHYVKMPATLAALAHPEIKGLYYLDLDAVSRFPWTHHGEPGIKQHLKQEHERGYSAVAFSRGSNSKRFHGLRWQVHGERFYARDSIQGRMFFANWFNNRCTFQDQYSLWHSALEMADSHGCLDYDGEIYRDYLYGEVKQLTEATVPNLELG